VSGISRQGGLAILFFIFGIARSWPLVGARNVSLATTVTAVIQRPAGRSAGPRRAVIRRTKADPGLNPGALTGWREDDAVVGDDEAAGQRRLARERTTAAELGLPYAELMDTNRMHERVDEARWSGTYHFILTFRDETLECVARRTVARRAPGATMPEVIARLAREAL